MRNRFVSNADIEASGQSRKALLPLAVGVTDAGLWLPDSGPGHTLTDRLRVCNACPDGKVCGGTLRSCKLGMSRAGVRDPDARCPADPPKW